MKEKTFKCDCHYPCGDYPECGGIKISFRPIFQVREYTRDIKGAPGHEDFKGYWIYVSGEIFDYYEAIQTAIRIEKMTGIPNWVELITEI